MTEISPYPVPSPTTPRDPTTANPLPSPSMYAERQSQWKGRRGKPRCDHCRAHNLKCDRVLPICNHCAWAHRECKYTPLPTPAHRGIPRCDRCRFHNLKCDRSLPVCNNCQHDPEADCNYTPKKRHKVPTDHAGHPVADRSAHYHPYAPNGRSASFLASEGPSSDKYATSNNWIAERPDGGPKGKLPASMYELSSNSGSDDGEDDDIMEIEGPFPSVASTSTLPPPHPHEQRPPYDPWTKPRPPPPQLAPPAQHRTPPQIAQSPHPHHPPPPPVPTRSSSASAPVPGPSKARAYDPRHLEPWYHAHFAPLPRVILQGIRTVNPGDMPSRKEFDAALIQFVAELPPDLREVAMLPPDSYSAIAMAIKNDGMSDLSKRSAGWVGYHHVRLGSRKFNLLVVPREDHFIMTNDREEALLSAYMADIDGEPHKTAVSASNSAQDGTSAFMRIPVSTQIYDVLVYAHKKHPNTIGTLVEARNAGISCITWPMVEIFYRLCPRCMAKNKS